MDTVSISYAKKRQAIELGLAAYIQDVGELKRALDYWDTHYQDKPMYVLNRFIYDVCVSPELKAQRTVILRSLLAELLRVEKQSKSDTDEYVIHDAPETVVLRQGFVHLLDRMYQTVQRGDQSEFTQVYATKLKQHLKLTASVQFEALSTQYWTHMLDSKQYLRAVNLLYEVYCEFYGPMDADKVLSQAKRSLKDQYPTVDLSQLI